MKLKKILFLLTVMALISGCASAPPYKGDLMQQRIKYVDKHPDLPLDIANAIMLGEIIPGLTQEQVEVILGKPSLTHFNKKTEQWRWVYYDKPLPDSLLVAFVRVNRKVVFFDKQGIVTAFEEGQNPAVFYRLGNKLQKLFGFD